VVTDGRVGIGTTTPDAVLAVVGKNTADVFRVLGASTTMPFVVKHDGKVGVGIDAPTAAIDIRSDETKNAPVARFEQQSKNKPTFEFETMPTQGTAGTSSTYTGRVTSIGLNDTVTLIDAQKALSGSIWVTIKQGENIATALIVFAADGAPNAIIASQGGTITIDVTTDDVTGSTGVEGNVTLSFRANGVIEVENMAGADLDVRYTIMGD